MPRATSSLAPREIAFLPCEALVEARELVTQAQQRLPRIVHLGDLRRESLPQPVSNREPQFEVGVREREVRSVRPLLHSGEQCLPALRGAQSLDENRLLLVGLLDEVHVTADPAHVALARREDTREELVLSGECAQTRPTFDRGLRLAALARDLVFRFLLLGRRLRAFRFSAAAVRGEFGESLRQGSQLPLELVHLRLRLVNSLWRGLADSSLLKASFRRSQLFEGRAAMAVGVLPSGGGLLVSVLGHAATARSACSTAVSA